MNDNLKLNYVKEIMLCYNPPICKPVVDILKHINDDYNWKQIEQVRLGLLDNLDVSIYTNLKYDWKQMEQLRLALFYKTPIDNMQCISLSAEQMAEIRLGEAEYLDTTVFSYPFYNVQKMRAIKRFLKEKFDPSKYHNFAVYNDKQIDQITMGLIAGVDVSVYDSPKYKWKRMQEIRMGLFEKLNVKDPDIEFKLINFL